MIVASGLPITLDKNGVILEQIMSNTSFQEFYNATQSIPTIKTLPISINAENPFGVTVQGNIDSGRVMYTKTVQVSMPATRDGKAEEFIMGLQGGIQQAILVVERANDGSENSENNDVFGSHSPVRIDPASVTRSEYENGGAWNFNLVCEEPVPNVFSGMSDLSAVLDAMKA